MTDRGRSSIIETVQKLLAKAGSENEHEAAAFAAKAQELMTRHNIAQATLDEHDPERDDVSRLLEWLDPAEGRRRITTWKLHLANAIAENNGCVVFGAGPRIGLIGRRIDFELVRILYEYCVDQIARLAETYRGARRLRRALRRSISPTVDGRRSE